MLSIPDMHTNTVASRLARRRNYGVFYSRADIISALCQWAIRTGTDTVLEPSFGACGFLETSRNTLQALGSTDPLMLLYGCDIDQSAFADYLASTYVNDRTGSHFVCRDFLEVSTADFPASNFDVIIGNPPYVSYHNMAEDQRSSANRLREHSVWHLDKKASLWAYFVLHSLSFLKQGGRMAWILPGSFLHADYAVGVREHVANHFDRSLIVPIGQRLFLQAGTDESSVVLLADGWHSSELSGSMDVAFAETVDRLVTIVEHWQSGSLSVPITHRQTKSTVMSDQAGEYLDRLDALLETKVLGDLFDVHIGIVTGANRFFVLDVRSAEHWGLPADSLRPIVAKFGGLAGLTVSSDDLDQSASSGARCLLVDTSRSEASQELSRYLATMPEAARLANKTFRKRSIWHRPDDGRIPEAFFPYMQDSGPKIVLNSAGVNSTNTVHRLYKKGGVSETTMKAVALSMMSTYSQLSAELQGRSYGSGVLKHEPSEARRISVILPSNREPHYIDRVFHSVDELLRTGEAAKAQDICDQFIASDLPPCTSMDVLPVLRNELLRLRSFRRGGPDNTTSEAAKPS